MHKILKGAVAAVCLLFSGCVTMADYNYAAIDHDLGAGEYTAVQNELQKNGGPYTDHDEVLRQLDLGLLTHYARQNDESNTALTAAEQLIEANYTKSISQSVASFLTNDTVQDYAGETFEDIYTNIFKALNYLKLGSQDDAMVEIRRFDNKLKVIGSRYDAEIAAAQSGSNGQQVKKVSIQFHDSALARYLSLIMYRAEGDLDNARVDYKYLQQAFSTQSSLFPFDIPSSASQELTVPKGKARLNVISFTGCAPVKKETVTRVWSNDLRVMYKLALPVMEKRPSQITGAHVLVVGEDGSRYDADLEKIESLENISVDTFQQKASLLYTKALIRSIAKAAANTTFSNLANDKNNTDGTALLFSVLDLATKVSNEVTERADVRTCRFFPATASVAGISLAPGTYTVTVDFYRGHEIDRTTTQTVTVTAGGANIVEADCLR